jgi:peptide/nickel transport system substrate-binding protein
MKEHQRIWRSVMIVGVLALVAAACGPAQTPPVGASPGATTTPAADQPQKGGRIIEGTFSDIRTLQPILVADNASGRMTDLIYDGLVSANPKNGEPIPGMAKFEVSQDSLTYTFEIDQKAVWSDGKPVIAEDWYVAKKLVAMSKVSVRQNLFQDIAGWKAFVDGTATEISGVKIDPANPKKFTVTMAKVFCDAILNIPSYTIPAHVFGKYAQPGQKDAIDKAPENTAPTVFSGPFKFKEWRQGDQVILTRNDTYWRGAPHVDEYIYKVVADATVLAAQLKTGELNHGLIEAKDLADMERQENVKIQKYIDRGYTYIGWRTDSPTVPAFADKRVRQALAYGLDMDAVVKNVLFGEGFKLVSHHIPIMWAAPDPKVLNQYPYDKAKAEDLLKQAGYAKGADGFLAKDGKKISFTIRTNAGNKGRETLAQIASEQYKAIGIEAKTNFEAFQGLVTQLTEGHPSIEAVIIGWTNLGNDPYGVWHSSVIPDPATKKTGFGFTAFKSAELDKSIEEGRNPTNGDCTVATRKKHYEAFNKILNEEQPYNFGFGRNFLLVTAKNLQNVDPGSYGVIHNVHEWWFKK